MKGELERAQPHGPTNLRLIAAWVGAPFAFLADLQISYVMVYPLCRQSGRGAIFLPTLGALAVLAAGAFIGRRGLRQQEGTQLNRKVERSRFMAISVIALNAFFAVVVVGMAVAKVVIPPCAP